VEDDRRLITECLSGQTAAFGELVKRYQDRLYNVVLRLVNNPDDAQDVVQDALINAYQNLAAFKGESAFFTWLYRIAINAGMSHRRKSRGMLRLEGGPSGGVGVDPPDESLHNQPCDALERAEEEAQLRRAMNQLSKEHNTILVLKDFDGRKYEEIAEILGVPIGTVRSRLHRARLELKMLLHPEDGPIAPDATAGTEVREADAVQPKPPGRNR
jgi:RNA polymerase sigma-70 factor (ECF subfamily)